MEIRSNDEDKPLDAAFHESTLLSRDELRRLQQRTSRAAWWRVLIHFSLLLTASAAVVLLAASSWWLLAPAIIICGVFIASMHAPLHECTHLTAFRERSVNWLVARIAGFALLVPPAFYRDFHYAHHRHTHDPERDPEILSGGEAWAYWPIYVHEYLALASGLMMLVARLGGLLLFSLGTRGPWWDKSFPFVRQRARRQIVWEARIYLTAIVGLVSWGLLGATGLLYLLLAVVVGFSVLALYLASEHTGLPTTGSIYDRTRTTLTNPFVRFVMWNMPYHAEHHAFPAVPFHALPELHEKLKPELVHTSPGYIRLQGSVIRNLRIVKRREQVQHMRSNP